MTIDASIFGLNNYELKAYEALIKTGTSTATHICKVTDIPQGKIYTVLESLIKKGLVDLIPKEPKEFIPNNPDLLSAHILKKGKEIEEAKNSIEQLKSLYQTEKVVDESKIIVRQGKKSFYALLKHLIEPKKYRYAIKWTSEFDKKTAIKQKDEISEGVDVKVLTRFDDETKSNVKKWLKIQPNIRKIRNEGVVMSIIDDEQVMITILKCNATLIIRDQAFCRIMKKMFLETYRDSEYIEENKKENEQDILDVLHETIDCFNDKANFSFIGIIGSFSRKNMVEGSDLDLVTIGSSDAHEEFKRMLTKNLKKININTDYFNHINEKFLCPKNALLIHDLYYRDLQDLLNREWKPVINTIKNESVPLHNPQFKKSIPSQSVNRSVFYEGYLKWINEIVTKENFEIFKDHILHNKGVFIRYGLKSDFNKIEKIINSKKEGDIKLVEIKEIIGITKE